MATIKRPLSGKYHAQVRKCGFDSNEPFDSDFPVRPLPLETISLPQLESRWQRLKHALIDPQIRREAALHMVPLDRFNVRLAHTTEEHEQAFHLCQVAYLFQGIEDVRRAGELRIVPQHLLPESFLLVAYEDEQLVGTMTVTLDSPAGLPLDKDYPEAIRALRAQGARLAEYGALAIVKRCQGAGVANLLSMAATFLATHVLSATHIVIGVHPQAACYFRAIYGFSVLGPAQPHTILRAPVIGMAHELHGDLPRHLRRHFSRPMQSGELPWVHYCQRLPACIEVPQGSIDELKRWKLPCDVFRELFIHRSNRLRTLDTQTRGYLGTQRSEMTLRMDSGDAQEDVASKSPRYQ